jgi:peptide/nickel transport system permease protein
MERFGFVGGRLLQMIPVVLGVTIITFFILRLIPGDPVLVMLGTHYTPKDAANLRAALGLSRPLWEQYLLFMNNLIHVNLGDSIYYRLPVATLIGQRLPATLWLVGYSAVLALIISLPLATLSAIHKDGIVDQVVRSTFLLAFAMPAFWVGLILILLLSLRLHLFPVSGYGDGVPGHLWALFLPALTIALGFAAILIRTLRNSILAVLRADYLDTARAKGLSGGRILWRHVLRNALLSTLTVFGVNLAYLIGGTVIIENVFAVPGLGQLLTSSIFTRDLSVVQGITLIFALFVVGVSLLTDVAYAALDPRVAYD